MEYSRLGNTGLLVSQISYGSWRTTARENGPKLSLACHQYAFEKGINLFDTADVYDNGEAEKAVGEFLKGIKRSDIVLATKCCGKMGNQPNDQGLSKKHIIEACEASLKRLSTDYIDLYQAHREDPGTPLEETVSAFNQLLRQGKILYWGVSNWSVDSMAEVKNICTKYQWENMISLQPKYHLFQRHIEKDLQPYCLKNGIGMILYSPLAQGILTDKYRNGVIPTNSRATEREQMADELKQAYNIEALKELYQICDELSVPLSALSLKWLLRQDAVSSTIIGAKDPSQIEENLKAIEVKISNETFDKIEKILSKRLAQISKIDAEKALN